MKSKKIFFARLSIYVLCLCLHVFCNFSAAFAADELPRAQLDEAERHFTEAYRRLLLRDNWGALDYLDRALKANTYLVDQYLMNGLVMNRTGSYGAGREALEYYLEVRPMDLMAPRILSYSISQQRWLQRILSPAALSAQWRVSKLDMQNELELGYLRTVNATGMGKAAMWGENLYLADTMGNRVFYKSESGQGVRVIDLASPAAVLPTGDDSFYIITTGGEVHYLGIFELQTLVPSLRGVLENSFITDAAFISESEFVAADSVTREIAFYSLATLTGAPPMEASPMEASLTGAGFPVTSADLMMSAPAARTASWSPPDPPGEGIAFFEPVAVAPYGQWLAVADRGSDKIFFLNLASLEFFSTDAERPRDVTWSALGELFVINEGGDIVRLAVDFRDRRIESSSVLERGVANGWTFFNSPDGDIYCVDISGSWLWKAVPMPDASMAMGEASVFAPKISREENRESFILDATFMSPFKTYSRTAHLVSHVVWNNRTMPSVAAWNEDEDRAVNAILFNRPIPAGAINPSLDNVAVESGLDVRISLPSVWGAHNWNLTNLILDSTIDLSPEDLNIITMFCLNNGVELDIWARGVPSAELTRASGLTGGKTVFSVMNQPDLSPPFARMRIRVPLPEELSSSGYPSRSMLSFFLDVGLTQTRDWIPLWPDMLEEPGA